MSNLIALADLRAEEIQQLLIHGSNTPDSANPIKKEGRTLETLYAAILCWPLRSEGETGEFLSDADRRTIASLQITAKQMGAVVITANPDPTESTGDIIRSVTTLLNQAAIKPEYDNGCLLIRCKNPIVVQEVAELDFVRSKKIGVLNAGFGANEDPLSVA